MSAFISSMFVTKQLELIENTNSAADGQQNESPLETKRTHDRKVSSETIIITTTRYADPLNGCGGRGGHERTNEATLLFKADYS